MEVLKFEIKEIYEKAKENNIFFEIKFIDDVEDKIFANIIFSNDLDYKNFILSISNKLKLEYEELEEVKLSYIKMYCVFKLK